MNAFNWFSFPWRDGIRSCCGCRDQGVSGLCSNRAVLSFVGFCCASPHHGCHTCLPSSSSSSTGIAGKAQSPLSGVVWVSLAIQDLIALIPGMIPGDHFFPISVLVPASVSWLNDSGIHWKYRHGMNDFTPTWPFSSAPSQGEIPHSILF